MCDYEYFDPTEGDLDETARSRAEMEREFGMPSQPHPSGPLGDRVNKLHRDYQAAMNDEFGWPPGACR
jgi:hypothetical protein